MIAPGNHGDFGFAAGRTTPVEGFFDGGWPIKCENRGLGIFLSPRRGELWGWCLGVRRGDNRIVVLSRLTVMRIFPPLTGPHSDEGGVTK